MICIMTIWANEFQRTRCRRLGTSLSLCSRSSKYITRVSRALSQRSSNACARALSRRDLAIDAARREQTSERDEKGVFPAERWAGISVSPTIEGLSYDSTCRRDDKRRMKKFCYRENSSSNGRPQDNINPRYLSALSDAR